MEENADLIFGEEALTVTYRYEKIVNPDTGDHAFVIMSILTVALFGSFSISKYISKRH